MFTGNKQTTGRYEGQLHTGGSDALCELQWRKSIRVVTATITIFIIVIIFNSDLSNVFTLTRGHFYFSCVQDTSKIKYFKS